MLAGDSASGKDPVLIIEAEKKERSSSQVPWRRRGGKKKIKKNITVQNGRTGGVSVG